MRLEPSRTAATASLTAAMAIRLFYGLALDAPEAANAAWLAAPLGLLLALPLVWLTCRMDCRSMRALSLPLFVALALDAAASIEWTAYSESCLAFEHISPTWMTLPLLVALARVAWLGGDALGGAARFWVRLFALLMAVVLLYQLPYYNPGWLAPWLGNGRAALLRVGVRAGGWCALLGTSAAAACEEELRLRDILPAMALAAGVAAALLALRQMMAPVITSGEVNRSMRLDALLTNGRAPLYLQLPMLVSWFAGMLHLMAFEGVATCALLRRLLPRAKEAPCAALGLGIVFVLALTRAPRLGIVRDALLYLYHALAAAALMSWLIKERKPQCASSA